MTDFRAQNAENVPGEHAPFGPSQCSAPGFQIRSAAHVTCILSVTIMTIATQPKVTQLDWRWATYIQAWHNRDIVNTYNV